MKKLKLLTQQLILVLLFRWTFAFDTEAETKVATSERVIDGQPIVIQTQARDYDNPTLFDYQKCHEDLDQCYRACEGDRDQNGCEEKCPKCPILIDEDMVVQGINDTDYRTLAETALNTTNIIRLTNEIRNIVENNMGNITAHNENNVYVQNNASTTGGKFGLGYNENGTSCCLVVRSSKSCNSQRFSTASRCHQKRSRECGHRCRSRVMYAKRVKRCTNTGTDINCRSIFKYVPYKKSHRNRRVASHCQFIPRWPYVNCGRWPQQMEAFCQQCMSIPYGQILIRGIPQDCSSCYHQLNTGMSYDFAPQLSYTATIPYAPPSYFNSWEDMPFSGDGWTVEAKKCRRPDGTIVNCTEEDENLDETDINNTNPSLPSWSIDEPVDQYYTDDENDDDVFDDDGDSDMDNEVYAAEPARHRRQMFIRSAYSHRNS